MRKFEVVTKYLDASVNLPQRASKDSAGYDFEVIEEVIINPGEIKLVPTGVKALFPSNEVLLMFPRSSLALKRGLMMSNGVGVIDADYYYSDNEGHIMVPLYNFTDAPITLKKHERISQGIFTKFFKTDSDEDNGVIRSGGFGSSGK